MPSPRTLNVVELVKLRRERRDRRARRFSRRLLVWAALALGALSLAAALLSLAAGPLFDYLSRDLPSVERLPILLDSEAGLLLQPTRFTDRNGLPLYNLEAGGQRRFAPAAENPYLAPALVADRDPGFYQHAGYRYSLSPEAQTLAEELALEFLLDGDADAWTDALRMRMLAAQIIERYGRQQILTWSANSRNYGHDTIGIGTASQLYFGKPAEALSLAEVALLVGIIDVPELNPFDAPGSAQLRQAEVLLHMLEQHLISDDQARAALAEALQIQAPPPAAPGSAPEFIALAGVQAEAALGAERLALGGLEIATSLDLTMQEQMEARLGGRQAEAVVLDASNGQILAVTGSATSAEHQPGGLLAPFVYLTAFANGFAPASLAWDVPARILPDLPEYANPSEGFQGPLSLRQALANGDRVATIFLADQLGLRNLWRTVQQAGLEDLAAGEDARLLLEGGVVSTLQAAQAFATLANGGLRVGIASEGGNVEPAAWLEADGNAPQKATLSVADPALVYLVTDVLADASARRNGASLLGSLSQPAALSLAQSPDSAWAVGYSPQLVVALRLPAEDADGIANLWSSLFEAAHRNRPVLSWQAPPGLSTITVCVPSGLLPDEDCPQTRRELFLSGNEPHAVDDLYQRLPLNRLNGKLATVYTPQEFIEERLLLNVPPEARQWALEAGLPIIPDEYDLVLLAGDQDGQAYLESPEAFSTVGGRVSIRGRAGGEDFAYYRLLVGKGAYPRSWIELGPMQLFPVQGGELGVWDTNGLEGLYAIQLQVVKEDGSLETAYSLVRVGEGE